MLKKQSPLSIVAPSTCCLIESPEQSIRYFNDVARAYRSGLDVEYDLSKISYISESFSAVMVAHIKDRNINFGRASTLAQPDNEECRKKLRGLGIFKKVNDTSEGLNLDHIPVSKVTNVIVANDIAKEVVKKVSVSLYGEVRRIKQLYAILIEIMANTNNHAASGATVSCPWWLFFYYDMERQVAKFVFLDLGVGLFESLPVKQYMIRNPFKLSSISDVQLKALRGLQLTKIFSDLVAGRISSSTGRPQRGRGMPLISESAKSGHFSEFIIVSNDGYVDVVNNSVSEMNEHFSGTLYYFEVQEIG